MTRLYWSNGETQHHFLQVSNLWCKSGSVRLKEYILVVAQTEFQRFWPSVFRNYPQGSDSYNYVTRILIKILKLQSRPIHVSHSKVMLCYITYTHQYKLLLTERPSPYNESLHAWRSGARDFFLFHIHPALGPPSLLHDGHPCSFPGIKQPGRGVDHPSTPRAKVDEYSNITPPLLHFLGGDVCLRLKRAVYIVTIFSQEFNNTYIMK